MPRSNGSDAAPASPEPAESPRAAEPQAAPPPPPPPPGPPPPPFPISFTPSAASLRAASPGSSRRTGTNPPRSPSMAQTFARSSDDALLRAPPSPHLPVASSRRTLRVCKRTARWRALCRAVWHALVLDANRDTAGDLNAIMSFLDVIDWRCDSSISEVEFAALHEAYLEHADELAPESAKHRPADNDMAELLLPRLLRSRGCNADELTL